jgi:thiol-disulfide isomerase/thioredoxin
MSKIQAQTFESMKFDDIKAQYDEKDDTLYVVNFWATWCKPCIEELPFFENCNQKYKENKVKIILVNLDFNSKFDLLVIPFIQKRKMESKVIHLTDTDSNTWINKVDSAWSGAIPATVLIKNGNKAFFKEGTVTQTELEEIINNHLK